MPVNQKRCVAYWYYAHNIYSIIGKRKRMKLPPCLVQAVRSKWPNEPGVEYVGFRQNMSENDR